MGTPTSSPAGQEPAVPGQEEATATADLIRRLDLPEELTTQQAADILGCCKHTVLQYLEQGLLEWRNVAPPSSHRAVFRFTLRSVLELRLGYQRGGQLPPPAPSSKGRRKAVPPSDYQPKHLRRKKSQPEDDPTALES
jgi:hypothetical protein